MGDSIDVKGPIGHVTYVAPGRLSLHKVEHSVSHLSMLCAGSGITPVPIYIHSESCRQVEELF